MKPAKDPWLSDFSKDVKGSPADRKLTLVQQRGFSAAMPRMSRGNRNMGVGTHKFGRKVTTVIPPAPVEALPIVVEGE